MMLVAIMSAVTCLIIFNYFVRGYLVEQHRKDGEVLADVIAASLSGRLATEWRETKAELVDSLRRHPKVAFVCVTDPHSVVQYTGVYDFDAWSTFQEAERAAFAQGRLNVSMPSTVNAGADLVVRTAHVLAPRRVLKTHGGDARPRIEGALLVGLHSPDVRTALLTVQVVQLGTVALVCIACFPIARCLMRRWTGPLRELVAATQHLAEGKPPKPVSLTTNDEMGYLSSAFNDMAAKLLGSRQALIEANETLEQKVQERTGELQEAVKKLDIMASTDPLTGLANRRAFVEALESHFHNSVRYGRELACVMIDLDGFKLVNDALGHYTGDRMLTTAAQVLKDNCRDTDVIARLGGDEFVVLMPDTDEQTALQVGDRILARFQEATARLLGDGQPLAEISMSVGLSFRKRGRPKTGEQLITQADQALYSAKGSGKACLRIYGEAA